MADIPTEPTPSDLGRPFGWFFQASFSDRQAGHSLGPRWWPLRTLLRSTTESHMLPVVLVYLFAAVAAITSGILTVALE